MLNLKGNKKNEIKDLDNNEVAMEHFSNSYGANGSMVDILFFTTHNKFQFCNITWYLPIFYEIGELNIYQKFQFKRNIRKANPGLV